MEIYLNKYTTASLTAIIAILLLVGMVMAETTDTATTGATVTINTFVDISITPCAGGTAESISYGEQDPGAIDVRPVDCHDATDGDLKVTVENTTNVPVTVEISGTDYTGPGSETIAVGNTEYAEDSIKTSPVIFTTTPATVWSSMGGTGSAVSDDLWYWLDIPNVFLTAGAYTSTYTIAAS